MRWALMSVCGFVWTLTNSFADDLLVTRTLEVELQSPAVTVSPSGEVIAVAEGGETVKLLGLSDGKPIDELGQLPVPVTALAFSPNGKILAAAGVSGTRPGSFELRAWRLSDKQIVYQVSEPNHRDDGDGADAIAFLRFSPDSRLLFHPAKNRAIEIYDLDKQTVAHSFPRGLITSVVAFDTEGKTIAVGTDTMKSHGGIHRLDLESLKGLPSRALLYSGVLDMAFTPDGASLYGGHRGWLYRLDTKTGHYQNALANDGHWVATALAFSPKADLAALLSGKELQVWETGTGTMLVHFPLADGKLAWSPDGRKLSTTTVDGKVRVWDVNRLAVPD